MLVPCGSIVKIFCKNWQWLREWHTPISNVLYFKSLRDPRIFLLVHSEKSGAKKVPQWSCSGKRLLFAKRSHFCWQKQCLWGAVLGPLFFKGFLSETHNFSIVHDRFFVERYYNGATRYQDQVFTPLALAQQKGKLFFFCVWNAIEGILYLQNRWSSIGTHCYSKEELVWNVQVREK